MCSVHSQEAHVEPPNGEQQQSSPQETKYPGIITKTADAQLATSTALVTPSLLSDSFVSITGQKRSYPLSSCNPEESNRSCAPAVGAEVGGLTPSQAVPRPSFSSLSTCCPLYPCYKSRGGTHNLRSSLV